MRRLKPYGDWSPQRWRTVRKALKDGDRTKRLILIILVMTAGAAVLMILGIIATVVVGAEVGHIVAVVQHHLSRRLIRA
jgi:hypothetical protein